MKIRIRGNSIRLRLSQTEVSHLQNSGLVKQTIKFGPNSSNQLQYAIQKTKELRIHASYSNNEILVFIPTKLMNDWAQSDSLSLQSFMAIGEKEQLKILIEKDLKCLKEREGEDESDLFPNKEEGYSKC